MGPLSRLVGSSYIAHQRIRHDDKIYVSGDVHTQTIDGFFGNLKSGIERATHAVSSKWLQGYLNEYVWRYNRRHAPQSMFRLLILRAAL